MAKHFNSAGHSNETQVKANVIDVIPKNIREGDRHKLLAQKEVFWIETLKYKDKLYGSNEDLDVSFFRHCLYSLLDVTPKMLFLLNILSVMVQCAQWPCHCFFLVYKMWNGVCMCVFCKTTCFSSMGLIFLGGLPPIFGICSDALSGGSYLTWVTLFSEYLSVCDLMLLFHR